MRTMKASTKTKGIIAAVAGGALLLGSGATFAFWEDDAKIEGTTITAGNLKVDATGVVWEYWSHAGTWEAFNPETGLLSPSMTVRGTASTAAIVEGTDLKATLEMEGGELTGDYADQFEVTWHVDGDEFTGASTVLTAPKDSEVVVTIHWNDALNDNDGKLETVVLGDMDITLTQITHTAPTP